MKMESNTYVCSSTIKRMRLFNNFLHFIFVILLLLLLGTQRFGSCYRQYPAFISYAQCRTLSGNALKSSSRFNSGDEALLDAQEAAALDAHDVSDPGIEGASMERAVMMAAELFDSQARKKDPTKTRTSSLVESIWSYFHHSDVDEIMMVKDAEANYAHALSDLAAIEHANKISIENSDDNQQAKSSLFGSIREFFHIFNKRKEEDENELMELRDVEANFAHMLSDIAALDHANEI